MKQHTNALYTRPKAKDRTKPAQLHIRIGAQELAIIDIMKRKLNITKSQAVRLGLMLWYKQNKTE